MPSIKKSTVIMTTLPVPPLKTKSITDKVFSSESNSSAPSCAKSWNNNIGFLNYGICPYNGVFTIKLCIEHKISQCYKDQGTTYKTNKVQPSNFLEIPEEIYLLHTHSNDTCCRTNDQHTTTRTGRVSYKMPKRTIHWFAKHPHTSRY